MSLSIPTPLALPLYGWNTREDQDDTPRGYSRNMLNVERRGLKLAKAKGKAKLTASAVLGGNAVQTGYDFEAPGGVRLEIVTSKGRVSKLVNGVETALETTMKADRIIRAVPFMGQLYYTNGEDVVRSTDGAVVTLITQAPHGRLIELYNDHLFIANVPDDTNGPSKLFNSDIRDPSTWNATDVYFIDTNNAEEITALFTLRGYLGVAKNDSISYLRGNFFNSLSPSYDAVRIMPDTGIGIASQGSVIKDEYGNLLFLSEAGFYILPQPGAPRRLSAAIDSIISRINFSAANLITAVRVPQLKEIWWAVPIDGSPVPNLILRYNYLYQTPDKVGTWWPLQLGKVTCLYGFEDTNDVTAVRGGDDSGFVYRMNEGYNDGGTAYNSFFEVDNIRHRAGGYGLMDWVVGRFDNSGNWNLTLDVFPGGMRNSPHAVTRTTSLTDDSGTTFFNRETVERQIPFAGLTGNVFVMKVSNNAANQHYGVHELAALVRPVGMFR